MPTRCPVGKCFTTEAKIATIYCGQWSCPRCAKKLAQRWGMRTALFVDENGGQAYFWTLTLRGKYRSAADGYRALPKLWDTFRKLIQRQRKKWVYIAFVEGQPQRDYMPHFHIITIGKAHKRLKDLAMQAGFGYQASEKQINGKRAASYVSKYASKGAANVPKSFRRVRTSRGFPDLTGGDFPGYIVKSKLETNGQYIIRVADLTGESADTLLEKWLDALNWSDEN